MKGENISLNFSLLVSIKKVNSDYMTFLRRQTLITLFLFWKKDSNINVAGLHGFQKGITHTVYFSCCCLFTILSIQILQSCSRFHKLSISMFCTTIMRLNCCKWFNEFFTFLWHFIVRYFSRFGFNKSCFWSNRCSIWENCFWSNSCSRWVITNRGRNLVTDGSWWHTISVSNILAQTWYFTLLHCRL